MRWRCSACEHENLGRHKQCQHCGKPKDREVFYDAPGEVSRADAITDAALLEQATAGADWECAYCGSHQRNDSGACVQCGAQQATSIDSSQRSAENSSAQSLPAAASSDAGGMVADSGARITKLDLSCCKSLKNVDGLAKLKQELDEMAFEERCRRLRLIRLAFACLFACLLAAILYGVLRPRYVDATVTAVSWTHTVKVLRYQVVTGSGFFKPPGAFDVEAQGRRHSHYKQVQTGTKRVSYEEKYACGTARVCKPSPRVCRRTPVTCKPNKNGFKTCTGGEERCSSGGQTCTQGETKTCSRTQYKTVPTYKKVSVIRMWYSWKVWAWRPNREVVAKGTSEPPRWPSAAKVGLNQKLSAKGQKERAERVAHYMVVLTDAKNRQHTFEFKDVKRFNALPLGQRRQLKLGVGRKTKVLPAN